MGCVYRNMKDMPIPSFAFPNRHDGSVYIVTVDDDGKRHRKTIGALTVDTPGGERMVPNSYFRDFYQDLWTEMYPEKKIPSHQMSVGIYALTLSICEEKKIYQNLREIYGPQYANHILDYAMFSIIERSDVTQMFEGTMKKQVLFSDKLTTDSWYSKLFSKQLTEDQHHQFRISWTKYLVKNGLKKVWLAIDGSNNDCVARSSFLAKYGFPKSHNTNKTIVGYMYAVDAETGRPVTYNVYDGSVPDCQAFQTIAVFLGGLDIEIEGVILDCGFAVEEVFRTIEEKGWKYVIMLPADTDGHLKMLQDFGETIRWHSEYMLESEVLFGISAEKHLWKNNSRLSNICLFFDGSSGSMQSMRLSAKILDAKKKIKAAIANGVRASVPRTLRKYLSIDGEGPNRVLIEHYDEWDKGMAGKGFFSIATSEGIDSEMANRLYKMRDTSETQFSILKTQEGGHVTRVHKTEGIYSKFALLFLSSIIRFEIEESCKKLGLDTNPTIKELDTIVLLYKANGEYESVRNLTTEQKKLFNLYGLKQDDFERFARDFNHRNKTASKNPVRTISPKETPIIIENSHKKGRPKNVTGSTVEENAVQQQNEISKSKGGRPKGKKDSKPRKPRSDKGIQRGPRKAI